jgi:alpha-D-xyloside xylohydrolase
VNNLKLKILAPIIFFSGFVFAQSSNYRIAGQSVSIKTSYGKLDLQIFSPHIIRVIKSDASLQASKKSLSVIMPPGNVPFKVSESGKTVTVSTARLRLKINLNTGLVAFYDLKDKLLLSETKTDTLFKPVLDNGLKTFQVKQQFGLDNAEGLYGLGQYQDGVMNYRGHTITLKNTNRFVVNPFLVSTKGYGILWDNYSKTTFTDNVNGAGFNSDIGDVIDYYFVYGQTADGTIGGYRQLTGQSPMYGKWVFGFWQSRERYRDQAEILAVADKYRSLKIPIDNIVLDWQYWGADESDWNSTQFSAKTFPDPALMIKKLHENNVHLMISVWPSFGQNTGVYKALDKAGHLYPFKTWPDKGGVKVYDAFDPNARDIYWDHMNANLFSKGIDAWWLDATEPEQSDSKSADSARTYLGSFKRFGNAFPLESNKGVYEHQRHTTSAKRVFILTRSAFSGQQRYGSSTWSGDINGNWDVFRKQIAGGLNFCMSGIPYWTTDIGGFFTSPDYPLGNTDPGYQELYVRWFQFGVFCPLFRSHGTNTTREIYQFGEKGYWAFDTQADFIKLRYRLLPYIYSLSRKVTADNYTLMRGLPMDFPGDTSVYKINNEYMLGPSLLVSPVTEPLYTKATAKGEKATTDFSTVKSVEVYLPRGQWYNFWNSDRVEGGKNVSTKAPINQMPVYVRAGSIIPMGPDVQFAAEKSNKPVTITIYPGADANFDLYEDENDNYNYEQGKFSTISFHWNDKTKLLTIGKRKGAYPGMALKREFEIEVVSKENGKGISSNSTSGKKLTYGGAAVTVLINTGK